MFMCLQNLHFISGSTVACFVGGDSGEGIEMKHFVSSPKFGWEVETWRLHDGRVTEEATIKDWQKRRALGPK